MSAQWPVDLRHAHAESTTHHGAAGRAALVRRGRTLAYISLALVTLEAGVSLTAGLLAGSVALWGYGADSVIEWTSAAAALWRLGHDAGAGQARAELLSRRVIGASFLALALIVGGESIASLVRHNAAKPSIVGIGIALMSLVSMPLLARAKRRVANGLTSGALTADAKQTALCGYLSAILLIGLALNARFGSWWADPLAALVMVPIIAREGVQGLGGQPPCADGCCQAS
jgi:divalent metal cation (Fe/Co/Zn/Cd) transporter